MAAAGTPPPIHRTASGRARRAALGPSALAALAALAATVIQPAGAVACPADGRLADPRALYGDEMVFSVLRGGKPVGEHRVAFSRDGDDVVVDVRYKVAIEVLFVTAYRYTYTSRSRWRDGCLVSLEAAVDDDGQRSSVVARADGDGLAIDGPAGVLRADPGVYPTDHWHPGVLGSTQVLNTLTGRINAVRLVERGPATVAVNGGDRPARHFAYTGDLDTEVWYDDRGRWVKLRFRARDGSTIESVCRQCADGARRDT